MTNIDELIRDVYALRDQMDSLFMRLLDLQSKFDYKSEMWNELIVIIEMVYQIEHGGDHHAAV